MIRHIRFFLRRLILGINNLRFKRSWIELGENDTIYLTYLISRCCKIGGGVK